MSDPTVAVAGIPGAWSSEALAASLRALGARSFVFHVADCEHDLTAGRILWDGRDLSELDGVVVKKLGDAASPFAESRVIVIEQLQARGVKVISSAASIGKAINRYRMTRDLAEANIPVPRTIVTESLDAAENAVQRWGRAVLKPLFTSKGRGMIALSSASATRLAITDWKRQDLGPMYLQEFVPNAGRDLAVAIMGGEVIGAYYRVAAPGEWMTTTAVGGRYEPCDPPQEAVQTARSAAAVFALEYTCVDLVETDAGWLTYEVSAFGGFSGLQKACDINAANLYASHALKLIAP